MIYSDLRLNLKNRAVRVVELGVGNSLIENLFGFHDEGMQCQRVKIPLQEPEEKLVAKGCLLHDFVQGCLK
jgi:hypothetical protein